MSLTATALCASPPPSIVSTFTRTLRSALIVDDSPVNRRIAGLLLKSCGYETDWASDSVDAIAKCVQTQFDVIIMDVILPGVDGLECTKYIRRHLVNVKNAVILGWSTVATWDECRRAGMDGMLPKPLDVESLRITLEHYSSHCRGL
jgi:CheY-like chemotaxis protein